jgi:uncharacterized membrane protein
MTTNRLEAFSDGVLAIIITIMVLELKPPHGEDLHALWSSTGTGLLTYVLSFVYVGIYWNNHHHMFQLVGRISGGVLWANLHLLFWLSLYPFTTSWMDESDFARTPVVVYGINLMMAGVAYYVLQQLIVHAEGPQSRLRQAIGADWKGKSSPIVYAVGIAIAFVSPSLAMVPFVAVALIWLVPDKRVERSLARSDSVSPAPD